jgi:5-methylcytosine-specific restriction endonuclease McrA
MPRGYYTRTYVRTTKFRDCQDHDFVAQKNKPNDCKICTQRYSAEHARLARTRTAAVVDAYKLSVGCAKCGYAEHPAALELDHIVPVTLIGKRKFPKTRANYRDLIFDPNIQVLCANCHRIKTRENGEHLLRRAD